VGASVSMRRRLEWIDTDAAGHWHNATLWRFVEEAEARLHRDLGIIATTFGHTPRRHVEAEYFTPLRFDRDATITLRVVALGRTSATYEVEVVDGRTAIATARVVIVFIDDEGRPAPWPAAVARALAEGDPVG
jgi:YbgC/YbaW family acyl-CoA thioester hydrolase